MTPAAAIAILEQERGTKLCGAAMDALIIVASRSETEVANHS
jgi:hypothetical protein